jgi:4-amino-4-deoxy-L-arabinose transferase-like glycosyltransferase
VLPTPAALCLLAVLAAQAWLSLRLVWSNTAFLDEATYLYGGRQEIAYILHGASVPAYATYFSGAPVIYPVIAAAVNDAAGLAGARLLSLAFMLGATSMLWGVAARLFGRRAALFATALYAVLGPTQFLGAFATYDAMALFLLTVAAWCVVAARDRADSTLFLLAGTGALAAANATKYATGLFDPTVIALAALVIARKRGTKAALARGGYIAASAIGVIGVLLAVGGPWYLAGVLSTTVARPAGNSAPQRILLDSWKWVGAVCVLAAIGAVLAALHRRDRAQALIAAVLAASGLLVPLNQARIHTGFSLSKHVDYGAWFAAAAAGYAIARLSRIGGQRWLHLAVAGAMSAAVAAPAGALGRQQAAGFFRGWPNSAGIVAALRPLTRSYPGRYLAEEYDVPAYYLADGIPWQRWSDTWYFLYSQRGARMTGAAAYRAAIDDRYFSLIVLDFGTTPGTDKEIIAEMNKVGGYHVITRVAYRDSYGIGHFTVWAGQPAGVPHGSHDGHHR